MNEIADRIHAELGESRNVYAQIVELLKPLRQWQRESILKGLYYYSEFGPGRLKGRR